MIIQYASDLHLEFSQNKAFLKSNPLQPKGDVLVLAGDIMPFSEMDKHKDFFKYLSDHFEASFWIPGNHEYYHGDAAFRSGAMNEKIRSNVFLVNNTEIIHNEVSLIFSTLWSKINPSSQWFIEKAMNDFQVIKYKSYRFSIDRFNELHEACLLFLKQALKPEATGKKVVITHHVPTLLHYPEQYKNSDLNEAFAVELFDFIKTKKPDYWIYGHHHSNTPDFKIGNTTMLTNQLGYVQYDEQKGFRTDAVIEIKKDVQDCELK